MQVQKKAGKFCLVYQVKKRGKRDPIRPLAKQSKNTRSVCTITILVLYTTVRSIHPTNKVDSFAIHLERDTPVNGVLKEETTVDLTLVKGALLESSIGNIGSTSGLLEYAELVLAATSEVDIQRTSYLSELSFAGGVVDGDFAVEIVSMQLIIHERKGRTYLLL